MGLIGFLHGQHKYVYPLEFKWLHADAALVKQIAAKSMIAGGIKGGRIVFVGSFLALTTFVGYAGYAPGKYALKGKSLRIV